MLSIDAARTRMSGDHTVEESLDFQIRFLSLRIDAVYEGIKKQNKQIEELRTEEYVLNQRLQNSLIHYFPKWERSQVGKRETPDRLRENIEICRQNRMAREKDMQMDHDKIVTLNGELRRVRLSLRCIQRLRSIDARGKPETSPPPPCLFSLSLDEDEF